MAAAEKSQRHVQWATRGVLAAEVQHILGSLVRERQELRRNEADKDTLEANRLAIVYWHQRLSHALIAEQPPKSG
jgi:hypothetical protein